MLVKLTSEQATLIGVTEAKDFAEKFAAFVQEHKELKDMAEQSPDFTALEKRVKALEDRPITASLTEAQVDSRVDAAIAGDKAKGVIETIASKKLAEAIGATGTTPAKPSPAPAAEQGVKELIAAGKYEEAYAKSPELQAEFSDGKLYAAYAKGVASGKIAKR
jgi:hypothetical protein